MFSDGETITFKHSNNLTTGVTGTLSSTTTPTGKVYFYDTVTAGNNYLHLANTSGSFAANTWIKGQGVSQATSRITTIDNLSVHSVHTKQQALVPKGATLTTAAKWATSVSARDANFITMNANENTHFPARARYILSRSNEIATLNSEKSAEYKLTLSSQDVSVSPAVDVERFDLTTVKNLINNDSTGEANTAGGNAQCRYITKTVTLDDGQDSDDLKVYITAYKNASATIEVYAKVINADDSDTMEDASWQALEQDTNSAIVSDNEDTTDFKEYTYSFPEAKLTGAGGEVEYTNSQGVSFKGYKRFRLKVVMLSSTKTNPPRMKDIRAIALLV
tara:strand:- start:426 stop:1427 length:1002 start_codon:yes stop_codon:yes gene_type:complete